MIVTLIGYRGTGKSSVAPLLAQHLGWSAVDADRELEARAGCSIREIFARDGEPEFRRLERETLMDLLKRDRTVLAAGGGAILNPSTRSDFRSAGPVVWLQASVDAIAARLSQDAATSGQRPSLTGRDVVAEISEVLAFREPLYRETASVMISTDQRTPNEIVSEILARLPMSIRSNPQQTSGDSA